MLPNSLFLIKSCLACGIHLQAPSPGFPGKIKFLASLGTLHMCAWLLHFAGELTLSAALQTNETEIRRQKHRPSSHPCPHQPAMRHPQGHVPVWAAGLSSVQGTLCLPLESGVWKWSLRAVKVQLSLFLRVSFGADYSGSFHSNDGLQFSSIVVAGQSLVSLFETPWTAACQASLSSTVSQNLLKFMSTESVMMSDHLIFCRPLLLLLSIFPSVRVFSSKSALQIRWPKHWSFSFSISPSNEYSGLISFRIDWFDLAVKGTLKSLLQHQQFKSINLNSKKMMLLKCCTQYVSKFGKLSSGHRTRKGQFSFQSQRRKMPKNVPAISPLKLHPLNKFRI